MGKTGSFGHHREARFRAPLQPVSFHSQAHWDCVLTSDVKLAERFESMRRTIYALGFTCVVIMGLDKSSKEVSVPIVHKPLSSLGCRN